MARENGEPSRNLRSISGGKQAIPVAVVSMLVLNFGDCAAHNWATGPEMSAADFEPPKARCFLPARHDGTDFAANASSNCGAGAGSGHAIGNSIRTRQNLNHCMLAGGRRITDQPTAAPQPPLIAQLKGTRAQLTTRMNAIRTKPIYTALQSHLLGVDIGRFTPVQIANEANQAITRTTGRSSL